eukprot:2154615-Rhodomonas_salina.2
MRHTAVQTLVLSKSAASSGAGSGLRFAAAAKVLCGTTHETRSRALRSLGGRMPNICASSDCVHPRSNNSPMPPRLGHIGSRGGGGGERHCTTAGVMGRSGLTKMSSWRSEDDDDSPSSSCLLHEYPMIMHALQGKFPSHLRFDRLHCAHAEPGPLRLRSRLCTF